MIRRAYRGGDEAATVRPPLKIVPPAPLEKDHDMAPLGPADLEIEIRKVSAELRNAIKRHRAAWMKMRNQRAGLEARGITYYDSDTAYKIAVADVRWWREEQLTAATTLMALQTLA